MTYANRNVSNCRLHQFACICVFALVLIFYSGFSLAVIMPSPEMIDHQMKVRINSGGGVSFDPKTGKVKYKRSSAPHELKKDATYKYTGKYGEKTSVKTEIEDNYKSGAKTRISKKAGGLMAGALAGSALQKANKEGLGTDLANGDYGSAALKLLSSLDYTGIGEGINGVIDDYNKSKQPIPIDLKKMMVEQQALNLNGYSLNSLPSESDYDKYKILMFYIHSRNSSDNKSILYANLIDLDKCVFSGGVSDTYSGKIFNLNYKDINLSVSIPEFNWRYTSVSYNCFNMSSDNVAKYKNYLIQNEEKIDDRLLNELQISEILLNMLKSQDINHTELMNYLNSINAVKPEEDLQSKVKKGFAISAPYTDAKTGKAQQTKFTVKEDGSIEIEYIPRPDLVPHTSQAPTRSILPERTTGTQTQTETQTGTRDKKDGSTPDAPDICAQNPDTVMCLEAGSDYKEDLEIPEEERNLEFKVKNIFKSTGTCPSPRKIELLGTDYEFTYQPLCDFAEKIRYMIIFLAVFMSMLICYNALAKE